jgi:hypothetical protein
LVWAVLGLALWFERYGNMHLQLFSVSHRVLWHIAQTVTGADFLIVAWLAYPRLGVIALPLGMLVGNLCFLAGYARFHSGKLFQLPFPWFDLRTAALPLLTLLLLLLLSVIPEVRQWNVSIPGRFSDLFRVFL